VVLLALAVALLGGGALAGEDWALEQEFIVSRK
jgi:hypothetical protein